MINPSPVSLSKLMLVVLTIFISVFTVYWNTLGNEFVSFDDRKYIYENDLITGGSGLTAIWTDLWNKHPKTHYYPMTFTTFWLENQLAGLEPSSFDKDKVIGHAAHPIFHVNQMLLHTVNSILIFLTLIRLGAGFWPSAFTALIFALHPVNVESVSWISERKNLMSAMFFWLSLLCYIKYRQRNTKTDSPKLYIISILLFLFALLSKSATMVLPPIIIITDRLLDRHWTWSSVKRSIPFFILSILMIYVTISREAFIAKSWEPLAIWIRPFISVAAIVHYVVKIFLPVNQALIYPRWAETLAEPRYLISLAAALTAFWLIWKFRKQLGDLWLWGLALFLITIFPIIGLKNFVWLQFAFVSDHYIYLGSAGIILMAGLLLYRWCLKEPEDGKDVLQLDPRRFAAAGCLTLLLLIGCGFRTVAQNRTWKNNLTLYSHILTVNPNCFIASDSLGNHYSQKKDYSTALTYYQKAAAIKPTFIKIKYKCGRMLMLLKRPEEAFPWFKEAVHMANSRNIRSWRLHTYYADCLYSLGRLDEAIKEYHYILNMKPPNAANIEKAIKNINKIKSKHDQ